MTIYRMPDWEAEMEKMATCLLSVLGGERLTPTRKQAISAWFFRRNRDIEGPKTVLEEIALIMTLVLTAEPPKSSLGVKTLVGAALPIAYKLIMEGKFRPVPDPNGTRYIPSGYPGKPMQVPEDMMARCLETTDKVLNNRPGTFDMLKEVREHHQSRKPANTFETSHPKA